MGNPLETIRAYEKSIRLPKSERMVRFGKFGRLYVSKEDRSKVESYARECREYLRFGKEVDRVVAGEHGRYAMVKMCDTPEILLRLGFTQKSMLYTTRHLLDAMKEKKRKNPHYHGLTIEQVKRLPEALANPVLIADNPSRMDSVLLVLPMVDNCGAPIVVSIKHDGMGIYGGKKVESNLVLTVFGKDRFQTFCKNILKPELIVYLNKKKGQELERFAGSQFPGNYSTLDHDTIIRRPSCLSQGEEKSSQKRSLTPYQDKVRADEHIEVSRKKRSGITKEKHHGR